MTDNKEYIDKVIKPMLEKLTGRKLGNAKRLISSGVSGSPTLGTKGAISATSKIYWGDVEFSLFTSTTEDFKMELTYDNVACHYSSGTVNTGYAGLVTIPFFLKDVLFNSLTLTRPSEKAQCRYTFNGWSFKCK